MSDSWLSIIEYARRYNVSDMTIRRRIKTGRLNAILRDGKYFIPAQAEGALAAPVKSTFISTASIPKTEELWPTPPHPEPPPTIHRQEVPRSFDTVDRHGGQSFAEPTQSSREYSVAIDKFNELCDSMLEKLSQNEEMLKANFNLERDLLTEKTKRLENEIQSRESSKIPTEERLGFVKLSERCDTMLHKLGQREDLIKANFDAERGIFAEKIKLFEVEIRSRDKEIQLLKKEIDGLENLVKVLEAKFV